MSLHILMHRDPMCSVGMLRSVAHHLSSRAVNLQNSRLFACPSLPDLQECSRKRTSHQQANDDISADSFADHGSDADQSFLQLYRRHNSSLKHLKGQVIGARVFKTDRRFVFLDTGFNKYVKYAKKELQLSQLVSSRDGGLRTSPDDFRVGDVLQFIIEEVETPYGDMQLAVERPVEKNKVEDVWEMVKDAMHTNQPVLGRVLNAVNGGYGVGVAGIVGFCPFSQMSFPTASRIGVLQPFHVTSMNEAKRNIVLQDATVLRKRRGPRQDLLSNAGAASA